MKFRVIASLFVMAGLLTWSALHYVSPKTRPLTVYCAESTRPPMEAIAKEYEAAIGRPIELRFGASETMLTQAAAVNPASPGDIFLPADESYIDAAKKQGLVTGGDYQLASMRSVVLLPAANPKGIATWADLHREGVRVAVANPGAAIGKLTREHLTKIGKWDTLKPHVVETGNVSQSAAAAKVGSVDAAIVWDAVAAQYPGQTALTLPELDGVTARVTLVVLKQTPDETAAHAFAGYVFTTGLRKFREAGFRPISGASP